MPKKYAAPVRGSWRIIPRFSLCQEMLPWKSNLTHDSVPDICECYGIVSMSVNFHAYRDILVKGLGENFNLRCKVNLSRTLEHFSKKKWLPVWSWCLRKKSVDRYYSSNIAFDHSVANSKCEQPIMGIFCTLTDWFLFLGGKHQVCWYLPLALWQCFTL